MLPAAASIPIVFVHGMLSGLLAREDATNINARALLAEVGIAVGLLEQPSACITADQYARLLRLLMARFNDEALGFFSRPLRPGTLALLTRSALGGPTLDVALRRFARAFRLLQDDLAIDVVNAGELTGVVLRFTDPTAPHPVFLHELFLRVLWRLMAWLVGGRLQIQRFDFAFDRPAHADSYEKLFPGPVLFNQQHSAFWVHTPYLRDPVRRDEAALRSFLANAQIHIVLPYRGEESLATRMRALLLHAQPRWPELDECASVLHMATSTLQRRLASENTSFRAIKDGLRRDTAIARLNSSRVPLARLAEELGFGDSAAFQRAFKTWTGVSPGSLRRPPSDPDHGPR